MRALRHRRQILLFLAAILAPCVALVALSLRMIGQERELADKRRAGEQQRALDRIRQDLLGRLERIKLEEAGALGGARYRHPATVLAGSINGRKLVLPWENDRGVEQFRQWLAQPDYEAKIRAGERLEFVESRLEPAARAYSEAMLAARHPPQTAYARLLRARALDKLGRPEQALADFRAVLASPPDWTDEDGVPLRLQAAEHLIAQDPKTVLEMGSRALEARSWLPPAGCYLVSTIAEKLQAGELRARVAARIREVEQAVALQNDFSRLNLAPGPEPVWMLYGEDPWLVSAAPPLAGPPALVALRAAAVLQPFAREFTKGVTGLRFLAARESGGMPLGENFPGLKVDFHATGEIFTPGLTMRFFYLALVLVLCAGLFGAYMLWRDLRREMRLAELQAGFVSSVSHELKTPLTAIRMFAETLYMGRSRDPETQSEYLATIVQECERLSRLVDDVLQFSKAEQGKKVYRFRPVHLAETVEAAARALEYPLAQKGFELRVEADRALPAVRADHDALEQAILNLLTNAMKYSGESRAIKLTLERRNGDAVIRVTDHGVGIAPEEQPRIFDKFYRVPTPDNQLIPGTGLGLTLVAQIVRAHGGRVEVESAPGQGSTFSIRLPLGGPNGENQI